MEQLTVKLNINIVSLSWETFQQTKTIFQI